MANYQGRRAPNVSQYIAGLNTIPDMSQQQEFGAFEDDLSLFTQGDFFDYDLHAPFHQAASPNGTEKMAFVGHSPAYYGPVGQFPISAPNSLPSSPPNGVSLAGQLQQSQPTVPSMQHFAAFPQHPQQQALAGQKRKASSVASPAEFDDPRFAVEEDKRRRNTAASARFRVKKKQREQALEKTAKEMTDRVSVLEARIGQLEMENQWLKGLITEKNVKTGDVDAEDIAVAAKGVKPTRKAAKDSKASDFAQAATSLPIKKRGVGTEEEAAKA